MLTSARAIASPTRCTCSRRGHVLAWEVSRQMVVATDAGTSSGKSVNDGFNVALRSPPQASNSARRSTRCRFEERTKIWSISTHMYGVISQPSLSSEARVSRGSPRVGPRSQASGRSVAARTISVGVMASAKRSSRAARGRGGAVSKGSRAGQHPRSPSQYSLGHRCLPVVNESSLEAGHGPLSTATAAEARSGPSARPPLSAHRDDSPRPGLCSSPRAAARARDAARFRAPGYNSAMTWRTWRTRRA